MKSSVTQDTLSDPNQLDYPTITSEEWEEVSANQISYEGEAVTIELGRNMLERVRKLASEEGITYQELLVRWIQVGMIAYGKKRRKSKIN